MTYEQFYAGVHVFMYFIYMHVAWVFLAAGELLLPKNQVGVIVRFMFKWFTRLMVTINAVILIFILGLLWETRSY